MPYQVAILTVSDTASKDASTDRSGPLAKSLIEQNGFQVTQASIVADDEDTIKETIMRWVHSERVDWIITSGGTGFGVRDRTPEAIRPLLDREAPGLVHLLLSSSIVHTPLASLSRPIAGSIKNTLVVTLPGSTKAVKENLTALLDNGIVSHALDLLNGGSGKDVHVKLAEEQSLSGTLGIRSKGDYVDHHPHHHHHHHGHVADSSRTQGTTEQSFSIAKRYRVSPYSLVTYEQALDTIFKTLSVTDVQQKPVTPALRGTVLAEDVYAPYNVPSTQTTNMDGYALSSTYNPGLYRVLTPRTQTLSNPLPPGTIYRINTGAPLPAGTDSVIMVEETELVSYSEDDEELEVRTLMQTTPGENVRAPGSDVRKGDLVIQAGSVILGTGGDVGTLGFVGRREAKVYRKPVVGIMSTGNELIDLRNPASQHPAGEWSGVWDTNRPSLQTALESMGYEVIDLGIINDDVQAHTDTLKNALQNVDLVLTTGGTSMGASDLLKPVIEKQLGGTIHFGRVAIKPGKPTTFATIPVNRGRMMKPLFALPGNPASALVCFYIFVVPALRKLGAWPIEKCQLPRVQVQIGDSMKLDSRTEFHRVVISAGPDGLRARSTGGQRSSRIASLSGANGLIILPQRKDGGRTELRTGEPAEAILIGEIQAE